VGDTEAERAYAESAYQVVKPSLPADWFDRVHESAVGAPIAFDIDGRMLTGGGAVNALTAYRVTQAVRNAGIHDRPLRVLEIGAGYGQVATQLFQVLDVQSYTVLDLVENLFLTAFYLQANLPTLSVEFIGPDGRPPAGAQLTFLAPPFADRLEGPFDLVINSYSFQEMDLTSVQRYFELAHRTLAPDGILYSLNSHGKAGVERPADYPLGGFRIAGMSPVRRFPWQAFATVPYELTLTTGDGAEAGEALERRFEALAFAMQLGLHDELEPWCSALTAGGADTELDALAAVFSEPAADGKREAIARLRPSAPAGVADYLEGMVAFAEGDLEAAREHLENAAVQLPQTHARARAELLLAGVASRAGDDGERLRRAAAATAVAPHLATDFQALSADPETLQALLASQLRLTEWSPLPGPGLVRQVRSKLGRRAGS
jgi:SAM-dependent methyltransferase